MTFAVLGIGSPHGDDQIGWLLVDELQKRVEDSDIHWEKVSAPVTSLVNQLSAFDQILVIDAGDIGLAPGESVFLEDAEPVLNQQEGVLSSHSMGLIESWQMAKALKMELPKVSLFLVQFEQCEPMQSISPSLEQKIPDMLNQVTCLFSAHKTEMFSV